MSKTIHDRFVRIPEEHTNGTRRVRALTGELAIPGNFLARLWACFGPPEEVSFETFYYHPFKDVETGAMFTAYVGAGGPALGGDVSQPDDAFFTPAFDVFEAALMQVVPVDCRIEFYTDIGVYRTGRRKGSAFGYSIYWHKLRKHPMPPFILP